MTFICWQHVYLITKKARVLFIVWNVVVGTSTGNYTRDRIELNRIQTTTFQFMCDVTSGVYSIVSYVTNQAQTISDNWSNYISSTKGKDVTNFRNRRTTGGGGKIRNDSSTYYSIERTLHADLNLGAFHYNVNYD